MDAQPPAPAPAIDTAYLRRVLRTLIGIDSILPHEERLVAYVADELRALGLDPEWQAVAPGRPNLYATADFGAGGRFLVFTGHSDTVGVAPGWQTDPFELVEQDGILHGLGVVNMKGGVACQLAALKALLAGGQGLSGRLGFALTVDEEGESLGTRALLSTPYAACDAMLLAEHFFGSSPDDYLPGAGAGKLLYRVQVQGRAAHGFRPHLGVNAVDDAARIVLALDRLPRRQHPQFGTGTVCTLKLSGGYGERYEMLVPAACTAIVNRLLVPGESHDEALQQLRELINGLGLRSDVEIDLVPPSFNAYALDMQAPILAAFRPAYAAVRGREPQFGPHLGITNANVFAGEGGIPTVVFGPKGGLHHSAAEYAEAASLEPVARVYAETARRYLRLVEREP